MIIHIVSMGSFNLTSLKLWRGDPKNENLSQHLSKVWKVYFWMRLLGSKYPKRSVIYSSTQKIWRFKTGKLRMGRRKQRSLLVRKYKDLNGKPRFVGKKDGLKHSANLGMKWFTMVHVCIDFNMGSLLQNSTTGMRVQKCTDAAGFKLYLYCFNGTFWAYFTNPSYRFISHL